jgi:phage tail-like protein
MAEIDDPKKSFNFGIIAAGLNPYTVQECNLPDFDLDIVEHGQDNHMIKTAGMIKFGDVTVNKLRPVTLEDNWIWDWIQGIQDAIFGGGQLPQDYKRDFDIVQYSYDNITITDRWEISGSFPKKINGLKLGRMKSENSLEEILLSVDTCYKTL